MEHNQVHNITPKSVAKPIYNDLKTLHGFACPEVLSPQVESERVLNNTPSARSKNLSHSLQKKPKI